MGLRLFAATSSKGKLRDFCTAAQAHQVSIEPLSGLDDITAPEEDGDTFLANAATKAVFYSRFAPGELVVADDSGLEVDALGSAPGVRSARFAADAGFVDSPDANDNTDVWNNIVLLQRLEGIPAALRTARYHCTLVAARDGEVLHVADGSVEGLILEAPRGTGGFGYDPLFYLPHLERTMAEIDLETKLSLSHRGRAIAALLKMLG
ncbi:MAG: non-canonical purine NTP pyrophosphatase [Terracidiphilus sp.]